MAEQTPQSSSHDSSQDASAPGGVPSAESLAEQALESAASAAEQVKTHALGDDAERTAAKGQPLQLQDLAPNQSVEDLAAGLGLLDDIDLTVRVELGRTLMYVEDVLRLNENSVVELDKAAGDPVDIYVNDRLVARGEVLVLNESFCVRISEIIRHVEEADGHESLNGRNSRVSGESGKKKMD